MKNFYTAVMEEYWASFRLSYQAAIWARYLTNQMEFWFAVGDEIAVESQDDVLKNSLTDRYLPVHGRLDHAPNAAACGAADC